MKTLWQGSMMVQVRREFWEHKSLWMAPLVGAALLLCGALFGKFNIAPLPMRAQIPMSAGQAVYGSVVLCALFIGAITSFAMFTYLLDCLHAERKDRSILFWKSLPVSDRSTVLTKLAVAMLIVPLGAWLLSLVTHLLSAGIMAVVHVDYGGMTAQRFISSWFNAHVRVLTLMLLAVLWYAPVATYLMLASVLARRTPLMMAMLPLLLPVMVEQLFFGTHQVAAFLSRRFFPAELVVQAVLRPGGSVQGWVAAPGMWLGLVAAAGMLYIVIRLRRYRDDT